MIPVRGLCWLVWKYVADGRVTGGPPVFVSRCFESRMLADAACRHLRRGIGHGSG